MLTPSKEARPKLRSTVTANPGSSWLPMSRTADLPANASALLARLLQQGIIDRESWLNLSEVDRQLFCEAEDAVLLKGLCAKHLLTSFQFERIRSGSTHGLMIGNYRILQRIGAGGMGTVFKAEQLQLRRPVAVKLLSHRFAREERLLARFWAESRAIARLQHPNIVSAIDAGVFAAESSQDPNIPYLVMEFLEGKNLEDLVRLDGPMSIQLACKIAVQAAEALAEAHRLNLIHRDIKPSNLFVTARGPVKVLDFGLVRLDNSEGLTEPGSMLGTIGYMPPEQAKDPTSVDERSDLYSLGASLYFALTGHTPFSDSCADPIGVLHAMQNNKGPTPIRSIRSEVPAALESIVMRLLSHRMDERIPTALTLMKALLPFTTPADSSPGITTAPEGNTSSKSKSSKSVLIVDDSRSVRFICKQTLSRSGYLCAEAEDGRTTMEALRSRSFDLVLLDFHLPDCEATELTRQIRQEFPSNLKIVVMSGVRQVSDLAPLRLAGVDDCFVKPFTSKQLLSILRANLDKKDEEERGDKQSRVLAIENATLKTKLQQLEMASRTTQDFFVQTIAELVNERCCLPSSRSRRLQKAIRLLAGEAAHLPDFHDDLTSDRINSLQSWIPILDIGFLLLPDYAMMDNSGGGEEADHAEAHTKLAGDVLARVMDRMELSLEGIQLAIVLARYHHERFDGKGFPDALQGEEIPLPARLAAIVDHYDHLRSPEDLDLALSHSEALRKMTTEHANYFDPRLINAFVRCADPIDVLYQEE